MAAIQQVKYAYKSIAEFVKHVTDLPNQEEQVPVFPELVKGVDVEELPPKSCTPQSGASLNEGDSGRSGVSNLLNPKSDASPLKAITPDVSFSLHAESRSTEELFEENKATTKEQIQENIHANKIEQRQRSNAQDSDDSGGSVLEVSIGSSAYCYVCLTDFRFLG